MGSNITVVLIAVVAAVIVGAVIVFLRRRAAQDDSLPPPPKLGELVDYTAEPVEDDDDGHSGGSFGSLSEQFASLPLPVRVGLLAAPFLIIGFIVIIVVAISIGANMTGPSEPTPPPLPSPSITIEKATVVRADTIHVIARTTNVPNGTTANVDLLADGEPFPWYIPASATTTITGGQFELRLIKDLGAPMPQEGVSYAVQATVVLASGQQAQQQKTLEIPTVGGIREGFFGKVSSRPPTPVPPTEVPTPTPTVEVSPTLEVTPTEEIPILETPTPEPVPQTVLTSRVFHGGNVREVPGGEPILDQVIAGEEVVLIQKTADRVWYQVRTPRETRGWVHYTLLEAEDLARVGDQVPLEGTLPDEPPPETMPDEPPPETMPDEPPPETTGLTARVFHGGNVREVPGGEPVLDQVNAGETVELLQKLADGSWYQIRNERGNIGWVHFSLLDQEDLTNVGPQVPVAP